MAHDEPQPKDSPKRKRCEPSQSQKAKTEITRISKDEMNMVEHPFASLSKETDARSIEFTWEGQHPMTGKTVQASWRVSGDPQLGLPTANDERIYLVLMELTRETGWEQTVHFTRHSLLKRLGWSDDKRSYQMLEQGLDRLATVTIHAQNAFWSPTQKSFYNGTFGILDTAVVTTERAGRKAPSAEPISFFKWNDIMFASLTDGNIRTLDLEFALSLRRPLSLRLYRYLDKKGHGGRTKFEISLHDLCEMHLGMVVEGRYESDLKAGLSPAHAELIERGFLRDATFRAMKTRKGLKVCYALTPPKALPLERVGDKNQAQHELPLASSERIFNDESQRLAQEEPTRNPTNPLRERMLAIGVTPGVVDELLQSLDHDQLRIQLDCLSDREPKDPPATFVKSVREIWTLPPAYVARLEAQEREQKEREATKAEQEAKERQKALQCQEQARLDDETTYLDSLWEKLPSDARAKLEKEATERLGVLGRTGRAQGALLAMRRNLLREMLEKAQQPES